MHGRRTREDVQRCKCCWTRIRSGVFVKCLFVMVLLFGALQLSIEACYFVGVLRHMKCKPHEFTQNLQDSLIKSCEVLNAHNITYWLHGGSLLGAVREHGVVMRHDYDADISYLNEDSELIFRVFENFSAGQFYDQGARDFVGNASTAVKTDLYPSWVLNSSSCPPSASRMMQGCIRHYEDVYHPIDVIFPLRSVLVGPLKDCRIPNDPWAYLEAALSGRLRRRYWVHSLWSRFAIRQHRLSDPVTCVAQSMVAEHLQL